MSIDNRIILVILVVLSLILIPIALFSEGPVRIILSFICLAFSPGYILLSAIFLRKGVLSIMERIALSFALSIAMVTLLGVVLAISPWGLTLNAILTCTTMLVLLEGIIAIVRQQGIPSSDRFNISLKQDLSDSKGIKPNLRWLVLVGVIVIVIMGGLAVIVAIGLPDTPHEASFYILDSQGKTGDYPAQVKSGNPVTLTMVVVNNGKIPESYRVVISGSDSVLGEIYTNSLSPGEKWEDQVSFVPRNAGMNQKIELTLYNMGTEVKSLKSPLSIYIDVIP